MVAGKRVLLLGAGFSRNWGGWLANEALEYLLGAPQVDDALRSLLISHKARGFEETLGVLQAQAVTLGKPPEALAKLEQALVSMFKDMNAAFVNARFDFPATSEATVSAFLRRFDAIFTLNQDTLLEMHYLNNVAVPAVDRHWQGSCLPGMTSILGSRGELTGLWKPEEQIGAIPSDRQPYIKLHGSSNWQTSDAGQLLIMGSNKSAMIAKVPILKWGFDRLKEYLSDRDTRLVVIGYSFGDEHINEVLKQVATGGAIKIFVVDPLGMDVMDKYRDAVIPGPSELKEVMWSVLRGCSRRPLTSTFGGDRVEHAKIMRFIEG